MSMIETIRLAVDQAAIQRYARITGDYNPIHVDPDFAARTEMGGVIAHGTMSMNLIWQALEQALGREALPDIELDIRFRRPVRPGDVVEAGGEADESGQGWRVWVRNQRGEAVIEGAARLVSRG
jgi:acyl dehydratase